VLPNNLDLIYFLQRLVSKEIHAMTNFIRILCRSLPAPGALSVTLICGTGAVHAEENSLQCMVTGVAQEDVLNIRREPDPHSRKIGDIPADARPVTKLGPVRQVGGGEWWRIRYDAVTGWVNARYLSCPLSSEQTEQAVADRARDIVLALRDRDMQQFACYVHPLKGVRFSPYGYVEPDPGSEASGMDRASLRLVLEKYNDSWYAVGIIHDEWTI
jgi:hypothetical protein